MTQLALDLARPSDADYAWLLEELAALCFACAQQQEGDGGTRRGDPERARQRGRIVHVAAEECAAREGHR